MSANTTAFVIVPGAWSPPACYSKLVHELEVAGFYATALRLPSFDTSDPSSTSCTVDAEAVRADILPLIEEQGKDVVIVCHSYGGVPAGGAARGLSKAARARMGKQGGIVALIYMTAFIVPQGSSVVEMMGGHHPPWVQQDQVSIEAWIYVHDTGQSPDD